MLFAHSSGCAGASPPRAAFIWRTAASTTERTAHSGLWRGHAAR